MGLQVDISRQSVHLSPCRPAVGSRTNAIQAGDDDDHDGVIALVGGQEPSTDPTESQGQFSEMMSFSLMRCAVWTDSCMECKPALYLVSSRRIPKVVCTGPYVRSLLVKLCQKVFFSP